MMMQNDLLIKSWETYFLQEWLDVLGITKSVKWLQIIDDGFVSRKKA